MLPAKDSAAAFFLPLLSVVLTLLDVAGVELLAATAELAAPEEEEEEAC